MHVDFLVYPLGRTICTLLFLTRCPAQGAALSSFAYEDYWSIRCDFLATPYDPDDRIHRASISAYVALFEAEQLPLYTHDIHIDPQEKLITLQEPQERAQRLSRSFANVRFRSTPQRLSPLLLGQPDGQETWRALTGLPDDLSASQLSARTQKIVREGLASLLLQVKVRYLLYYQRGGDTEGVLIENLHSHKHLPDSFFLSTYLDPEVLGHLKNPKAPTAWSIAADYHLFLPPQPEGEEELTVESLFTWIRSKQFKLTHEQVLIDPAHRALRLVHTGQLEPKRQAKASRKYGPGVAIHLPDQPLEELLESQTGQQYPLLLPLLEDLERLSTGHFHQEELHAAQDRYEKYTYLATSIQTLPPAYAIAYAQALPEAQKALLAGRLFWRPEDYDRAKMISLLNALLTQKKKQLDALRLLALQGNEQASLEELVQAFSRDWFSGFPKHGEEEWGDLFALRELLLSYLAFQDKLLERLAPQVSTPRQKGDLCLLLQALTHLKAPGRGGATTQLLPRRSPISPYRIKELLFALVALREQMPVALQFWVAMKGKQESPEALSKQQLDYAQQLFVRSYPEVAQEADPALVTQLLKALFLPPTPPLPSYLFPSLKENIQRFVARLPLLVLPELLACPMATERRLILEESDRFLPSPSQLSSREPMQVTASFGLTYDHPKKGARPGRCRCLCTPIYLVMRGLESLFCCCSEGYRYFRAPRYPWCYEDHPILEL